MKKALGQTVRDIKREVNKKVLKVPSIEQKVLDATSNEPWGPHGAHLADIAQATRNYHEYQMIMSVIWKRINDTGKNWRHVYKALTVLEYMVANGSERVIDDIREHAYQISTLSEFQYIDSSGRDQGSNVRKKSQSLVVLVNDKERIQEVRQKAAANREKYRNSSSGGMHRPGSHSSGGGYGDRYDDDRYGRERDEDRNNGYGREREDERYGRYGADSYGGPGDDGRSTRDSYRDDDYRGRSRNDDDFNYGSRSRSADRDNGDRSYEDDGQYSSRESYSKGDDRSQDGSVTGKPIERKFSEQNLSAPPSYEEAVTEARSPVPHTERDEEIAAPPVPPKSLSPPPAPAPLPKPAPALDPIPANKEGDVFDEFDPRGSFAAATPPASTGAELDLLSSLSDSFESNQMALVPATTTIPETDTFSNAAAGTTNFSSFSASSAPNQQPFDDPFGDGPFRAVSPATFSDTVNAHSSSSNTVNVHSSPSFQSTSTSQNPEQTQKMDTNNNTNFGSGEAYTAGPYATSTSDVHQKIVPSPQYFHQESSNPNIDILADILPQSLPQTSTSFQSQSTLQPGFPSQIDQQQQLYPGHMGQVPGFHPQSHPVFPAGYPSQNMSQPAGFHAQPAQQNPNFYGNFHGGSYGPSPPLGSHMHGTSGPAGSALAQNNSTSSFIPQSTSSHVPANTNLSLALVPQQPPAQEKFETKSTVWADTLNRGLVNLNISGPKTNPLADIGVDFDSINRREKRMEKSSSTPVISNITMGKAMGSGSGMGRAAAGALRSAPRPNHMMVGSGGGPPPPGMMGGGYAVNNPLHQQHMIGNTGSMNNMGNMVQQEGFPMHQQPPPLGFPPRGYNPMAGAGGGFNQSYGGYPR